MPRKTSIHPLIQMLTYIYTEDKYTQKIQILAYGLSESLKTLKVRETSSIGPNRFANILQ